MKRGIVLGASSGIGAALVRSLAVDGHDVLAVARRPCPFAPAHVCADVRDFAAVEELIREARAKGAVDYVVNCVGVGFYAPVGDNHSDAWTAILDTNVRGLLNTLSAIEQHCEDLPLFVHVSSLAAHRVSRTPGNLVYSVAKAGAHRIVEEHRQDLRGRGRQTRVSIVTPGFVVGTDFGRNYYVHAATDVPRRDLYGVHDNLEPSEVSDTIRYVLASPAHVELREIVVAPAGQPT
jgi:NADP-dependent 3-hydroxy acid dehydrogenase YdfG